MNFWFWRKDELLTFDRDIARCAELFPGKPILLGLFMHDYGFSDIGNMPELLKYQLKKAEIYIKNGTLEGLVILGDREIAKWPAAAAAIKESLRI